MANAELENTKRVAPPRTAASHTAEVDPTLSRSSSAGDALSSPILDEVEPLPLATTAGGGEEDGPGHAAQCTTTSAPAHAASRAVPAGLSDTAAAERSEVKKSWNVQAASAGGCWISTPMTRWPRRRSAAAMPAPRRPAAPVTTLVGISRRGSSLAGWIRSPHEQASALRWAVGGHSSGGEKNIREIR